MPTADGCRADESTTAESSLMVMSERVFARDLAAHVTTHQALAVDSNVDMLEVAGGVAAFMGVGSPLTTVKGLPGDVTPEELEQLEAFFSMRHVSITVELAPWSGTATRAL